MTIPLGNLYYIFCYAWRRFPAGPHADVGVEDCPDLLNLFAKVFAHDMRALVRRGLDRGYRGYTEETRAPRGKMLMDVIVKEQTLRRGAVVCEYDELTSDVLHNQILKATARRLLATEGLKMELKRSISEVVRRLEAVSDIRITSALYRRVQLSRNSRNYVPLLHLSEMIHHTLLPDEGGVGSRFADILNDPKQMNMVFEEFLRSFFAHEQTAYRVSRDILSWEGEATDPEHWSYVPTMQTDITLRSADRTIIADAKFYSNPFAESYGKSKLHAANLYQLTSYLRHEALKDHRTVDGMLIYPAAGGHAQCLDYRFGAHGVRVAVVDFDRPWLEVHRSLLSCLDGAIGSRAGVSP